jgi:predicted nuclease of restriction endonuclease-like (RecB) superfamily
VGHRIRTDVLKSKRAGYGDEICSTLSNELAVEFGNGYSRPNLTRMIRFAEVFPDREVVMALSRRLSWSHFVELIYLKDVLQRDFYAEMCRIEQWSVRTLRAKVGGMLFERTALSRKPKVLVEQELAKLREGDTITPDLVFRDPYFLDFLGLTDTYSENDLEQAILREIEQFILELGKGNFVGLWPWI